MAPPDSIFRLLEDEGPVTSSVLLRRLEADGLSPAAARKRVQRLSPDVPRFHGHGLAKNQKLLYLQQDWRSPRFMDALRRAWHDGNSVHDNALAALPEDGSPCPTRIWHTRSGAPIAIKRQISFDRVLRDLKELEFVKEQDVDGLGPCVLPWRSGAGKPSTPQHVRAVSLAEQIVLEHIRDWFRKLGFITFERCSMREDSPPPEFAQFPFDLVAPSYARPLSTTTKSGFQPGFVVADIWLGEELSIRQLGGFLRKTSVIRAMPKSRPFMSFLVADRFSKEAFMKGKSEGLLFTTPALLFGDAIHAALKQLIDVLTSAAQAATTNPDIVADLFQQLGRIEGAASNLRGPLFIVRANRCSRDQRSAKEMQELLLSEASHPPVMGSGPRSMYCFAAPSKFAPASAAVTLLVTRLRSTQFANG